MFKFEKLIDKATRRMQKIYLKDERCCKVRSPLSKCAKCIDSCPINAIEIKNSKIYIKENCIECGICAGECPTKAILIQEPTELKLYEYIDELQKDDFSAGISCIHNEKNYDNTFKVPCLGALTLEFLLGVNLSFDTIKIIYSMDRCKNCVVSNGIDKYLEKLHKIEVIKSDLGISKQALESIESMPKSKIKKIYNEDIDDERRQFLFGVFKNVENTMNNLPNIAIDYFLGSNDTSEKKIVKQVRETKSFNIINNSIDLIDCNDNDEIEFFKKPYLKDECKFCKACTILCPTGALKIIESNDSLKLKLSNRACNGCELCKDICYHNAIAMKNKTIYDICNDNTEIIAEGTVAECKICQRKIKSNKVREICDSCIKLGKK